MLQALTGLCIATLESFVVTPVERVKVFIITSPSSRQWWAQMRASAEGLGLFRGLGAVFSRQVVSWVSFLQGDHYCRTWLTSVRAASSDIPAADFRVSDSCTPEGRKIQKEKKGFAVFSRTSPVSHPFPLSPPPPFANCSSHFGI